MEKRIPESIIAILSILCHALAFFLIHKKLLHLQVPSDWIMQFYFLLGFSAALSLSLIIIKRAGSVFFTLLGKTVILSIIGYPLGPYLGIEFLLLTALLLEISVNLSSPYNFIFSSMVLFFIVLLQSPAAIWKTTVPGPSSHDIVIFSFISLIVLFITCSTKYLLEKIAGKERGIRHLNEVTLKLSRANTSFQEYVSIVEKQSEINERKRITREIHDTLGYTMTNIIMMLEAAVDLTNTDLEKTKKILSKTLIQAREGHQETRRALHRLRKKDALHYEGIISEVHKLVNVFQQATGVSVSAEYGNIPWTFGDSIDLTVFRLIQEGMTNSLTHGQATQIKIQFWLDGTRFLINIHDNGSGSKDIKEGIGFRGMRERIEKLEGGFIARNVLDGFQVFAWIPWPAEVNR